MKIIKTAKQHQKTKIERQTANIGCDICPCCGEALVTTHYVEEGILNKGIVKGAKKSFRKGKNQMQVDCYGCLTCGAQWESDPYRIY